MPKKTFTKFICALLMLCFLLSSCSAGGDTEDSVKKTVKVSIAESPYYTVLNNGLDIVPGGNAEFRIKMNNGELTGVNCSGTYMIRRGADCIYVTLTDVMYPEIVTLNVSDCYRTLTYDENGGKRTEECVTLFGSGPVSVTGDIRIRPRLNTAIGTDWFVNEGFTLECWNTKPDGTGERIGLGSRVSAPYPGITLYAVWDSWTNISHFTWRETEITRELRDGEGGKVTLTEKGAEITGCAFSGEELVIPRMIEGYPVLSIAQGAFSGTSVSKAVLPDTLFGIEDGAFDGARIGTLVMYDNLEKFGDGSFEGCEGPVKLYINAVEAPYGYLYRRESCYADKVDLLISAAGRQKLVFYSGCSMWYNLDADLVKEAFGDRYAIINMGLNGVASSIIQMEIMRAFLEDGDILFHTPEFSSAQQMLFYTDMSNYDDKIWCGIENNYDLFSLVDLTRTGGVFGSLRHYLDKKDRETDYSSRYVDTYGRVYMDDIGCLPLVLTKTAEKLVDEVNLDIDKLNSSDVSAIKEQYRLIMDKGVTIYLSCACVNIDSVPEDQRGNVQAVNDWLHDFADRMEGPVFISDLWDYLYHTDSFCDTNYHMLTDAKRYNTKLWIRDLKARFETEGRD